MLAVFRDTGRGHVIYLSNLCEDHENIINLIGSGSLYRRQGSGELGFDWLNRTHFETSRGLKHDPTVACH